MSADRPGPAVADLNDDQLAVALILGAQDYDWDYQAAVKLILGQHYWLSQDEFRRAVHVDVDDDGRPVAWVKWSDVELVSAASSGQVKILEFARSLAGIVNTRPLGELLTGLGDALDPVVRAIEFAGQGSCPSPSTPAVVLDPSGGELVETLWRIHEWARFQAEPDGPEGDAVLGRFADLIADVAVKLGAAAKTAPRLCSPDGRELASLLAIDTDLRGVAPALYQARRSAPDDQLPPDALKAVGILDRCAVCSSLGDGTVTAIARSVRGSKRLDDREFQVYQRFASLVLVDPLDRYAAMGPDLSPRHETEANPPSFSPFHSPEMGR